MTPRLSPSVWRGPTAWNSKRSEEEAEFCLLKGQAFSGAGLDAEGQVQFERVLAFANVQSLVALGDGDQAWKLLTRHAQPDTDIYLSAGITALRVAADADAKRFLLRTRRWADAANREPLDKALKALDSNNLPGALAALDVVE